uniref:Uncharacterized protein n=1 Tax=viral metagenome TaxID=1070528 RepID=A0A6C0HIS6_9ZZZZ
MSATSSNAKIAVSSATGAAAGAAAAPTTPNGYRLPETNTLQHASKLAIVEDKPIMFDYWTSSLDKSVIIGVKDNQEKLLVKSEEEYTSPISKMYKVATEYIIITENSIYLVDSSIATKRISS